MAAADRVKLFSNYVCGAFEAKNPSTNTFFAYIFHLTMTWNDPGPKYDLLSSRGFE